MDRLTLVHTNRKHNQSSCPLHPFYLQTHLTASPHGFCGLITFGGSASITNCLFSVIASHIYHIYTRIVIQNEAAWCCYKMSSLYSLMLYQDSEESNWILFIFCRAIKVYKSKITQNCRGEWAEFSQLHQLNRKISFCIYVLEESGLQYC